MLVLSYLWPFALIPYLMEKDDPEVQWHSKNGLVLLAAEIVINLVMGIIVGTGCLTCFLFWLPLAFWVADIGLHVYCIIKALDGKRVEIPYLSDLTRHIP